MPIFRKPSGEIDEIDADDVTTKILNRPKSNARAAQPASGIDDDPTKFVQDEPPTLINQTKPKISASAASSDEPKTRMFRPKTKSKTVESANGMDDPVVGWVVIINGPGQGKARQLGYGQNTIGRGASERISLDFGADSDSEISRVKHAVITFDPKGKKYYLHSGDGTNLTYLNDGPPVLVPIELVGSEEITIGNTTLRFVPFCGDSFDWQSKKQ